MDVLIGQLFTGLSIGSILLLAALGLSLTFGQMGVINMAHGEFIMAGSYTAYVVQQVARDIFGAPAVNVSAPSWLSGGVDIFGAVVPKTRIFILVLAIAAVIAL